MDTHKKQLLDTQLGQSATIQREVLQGELYEQCNLVLKDLGEELNPNTQGALKYVGSAAIHIYQAPTIGQIFFVSQVSPLGKCPEPLASQALNDLRGRMMEHYGRKAQTKRSGF